MGLNLNRLFHFYFRKRVEWVEGSSVKESGEVVRAYEPKYLRVGKVFSSKSGSVSKYNGEVI